MPSPSSIRSAFEALPGPVRASLWMVMGSAMAAVLAGLIRHISADMHPFQIVFIRNLFGVVFMLSWLSRIGLGTLRTRRMGLLGLRAVIMLVTMSAWFFALSRMPIAEAVSLHFTAPLFGIVAAILILGETVGLRRWSATLIGFVGMLIILRPGITEIQWPVALVLFSAMTMAVSRIILSILSRTESANTIVTYMVLFMTPMSLVPALFFWRTPSLEQLALLALLGVIGTLTQQCLARAFGAADASFVMPLDYLRLPFTALVGFIAFAQLPDIWTWLGAAVIVAASAYIARREAQIRRAAASPKA